MQAKNLILPPILSRRPHHPKQHTPDEIKLISNMRRRNPHAGLVVFCVKLRQRVQVHVKFVPSACLVNSSVIGKHFFQYTAIDEYSRWRFVEAFEEHSTYSSALFVEHLVKAFPCTIECIQTDKGTEFTNRFTTHRDKPTLFQVRLGQHGIQHKVILLYIGVKLRHAVADRRACSKNDAFANSYFREVLSNEFVDIYNNFIATTKHGLSLMTEPKNARTLQH